jgi:elongation factor Ts
MAFTATDVKNLRETTGVGMMDCKKALTESDGDFDKAVLWLREKGLATAQKKAGRIAAEGIVAAIAEAGKPAGIDEVNIETDFAAKNEAFQKFGADLAAIVIDKDPKDLEALLALEFPGEGKPVSDVLVDRVQVIGENIQIRRFERYDAGTNVSYVHMGGKIGVLIQLEVAGITADNAEVITLGKDLAMQIAAMRPLYLDSSAVSDAAAKEEEAVQKAKALEELATDEKKKDLPAEKKDAIAAGMVKGRMNKFFEDVCLANQPFVKGEGETVAKHVENVAKAAGGTIKLARFTRFEAGEGIEKKADNFADEVASLVK